MLFPRLTELTLKRIRLKISFIFQLGRYSYSTRYSYSRNYSFVVPRSTRSPFLFSSKSRWTLAWFSLGKYIRIDLPHKDFDVKNRVFAQATLCNVFVEQNTHSGRAPIDATGVITICIVVQNKGQSPHVFIHRTDSATSMQRPRAF